ncbi:MAG: hypothetical protein AAFO29_04870, partial [Actinomycetota bacterium]
PAESARPSILTRLGRAIGGVTWPWPVLPRHGMGRAAFAATVTGLVIAAAALVAVAPNLRSDQEAGPTGADDAPLSATTSSVLTASVPDDAAPSDAGQVEADGRTSAADDGARSTPTSTGPTDDTASSPVVGDAVSTSVGNSPSSTSPKRSSTSGRSSSQSSTTAPADDDPAATTTTGPASTLSLPTASTTAGGTTVPDPGPDQRAFDASRDLVALHFDHANNRDDGQATVADREIVADRNLDVIVVGGTYGTSNTRYIPESELVMDTTWGPNDWINAHANRAGAVTTATQRWVSVIQRGGDVWVAEGGPSEYTADVIRGVAAALPAADLGTRIHVVQHSGSNERNTVNTDLDYLKATIDYIKIDDGNHTNGTADLRQQDNDFVESARSGSFASAWNAAFNYLDPTETLDFSDTVGLLHIVGVGPDVVADPKDFADTFID